jgi:hypothetical protein
MLAICLKPKRREKKQGSAREGNECDPKSVSAKFLHE